MSKIVLLTGATGFLGTEILKYLKKKNFLIKVIVRKNKKKLSKIFNSKLIEIIYSNNFFLEKNSWYKEVTNNVDIVIHAAWHVNSKDYLFSPKNIECLNGSKKFAKACKLNKVKKFIGIGTCFEYDLSYGYLSTETPLKPLSIYAISKVRLFKYLKNLFLYTNTVFSWCRIFFIYGKGEPKNKLFSLLKIKLQNKKKIKLGNENNIRDYLNVNKAANNIVNIIPLKKNGVYNICSGKGKSIKKIADKFVKKYNGKNLVSFSKKNKKKNNQSIIVGIKN